MWRNLYTVEFLCHKHLLYLLVIFHNDTNLECTTMRILCNAELPILSSRGGWFYGHRLPRPTLRAKITAQFSFSSGRFQRLIPTNCQIVVNCPARTIIAIRILSYLLLDVNSLMTANWCWLCENVWLCQLMRVICFKTGRESFFFFAVAFMLPCNWF